MELKSPKPDFSLSLQAARSIANRVLPDADVTAVSPLHGGHMGAVFELALSGSEPPLVLKVYPEAYRWKMQKEMNVIGLIEGRVDVPVPRILLADESKTLLPLSFVLMRKIEGENLRGIEKDLAANALSRAYLLMGEALRKLHRISMEAFGYLGSQGISTAHATNYAYLTTQFDRATQDFVARGGDTRLAQRIADFAMERAHLLNACEAAVLCHNDFHGSNILVSGRDSSLRLTGVLDFENALAADPLMDLGKTLYCAPEMDAPRRDALLEGYGPILRSDWRETVTLYRLYHHLSFWCWMAMLGNRQILPSLSHDMECLVAA